MAKLVVECVVLVVADFEDTVLDPERVGKVLSKRISRNLGNPPIKILPIEKLDPLLRVWSVALRQGRAADQCYRQEQGGEFHGANLTPGLTSSLIERHRLAVSPQMSIMDHTHLTKLRENVT